MKATKKYNLIRDLWARRVPHILGTYAVSSSGVILFLDWFVDRYELNNLYTDVLLIAIVTLIPSIIMVSYFHGRPGKDEWMKTELVGIPVNLLITFFCIFIFVSPDLLSGDQEEDNKIFKSIAVLYLENLSNDSEGENWCAGITDGIITSISKLGIFNVKSRTDVLQFRRKVTSHDQIGEILGVDAYITGSLQIVGEKVFANISLIDTRNGVNIWAERFEKTTSNIFNIPKIISKEIAHSLGVDISPETLSSSAFQEPRDNRTFSLLGKGINLLDSGDFQKSITVFDSVLINEPDNAHALFSRAQALENLEQYSAAIKAYEKILPASNQYSRIQKIWEHPDLKNKKKSQDINLYERFLVSEELNIQIIPTQNKVQGLTTIFAIDLNSNKEIWKKTYKFMNMAPDIIGENLILSTSSIGGSKKEATVYVHSLKTGRLVCSREFVKEHPKQRVIVSVMKNKGNQNSKFQNIVFLNLRRDDYYEIIPLDPEKDTILWKKTFPLQAVAEGKILIYLVESDEKNYLLHTKGINLYLFSIDSGSTVWRQTLLDDTDKFLVHQDKIVFYSTMDTQIKINYIVNQKLIGEYDLQIPAVSALAMGENVFIRTQNSITSLRFKNRFLRGIENWTKELGDDVQIVSFHTLFNNVFALSKSGDLFCLNGDSGKIINKTNLNNYSAVSFHHDDKPRSIVAYDGAFLTGIDPHNGEPLWKIRELNVWWPNNHIQLSDNKLIIMKWTDVKNQISIKAYNRTTGELLWLSNEELWPDSSLDDWQHYIGRVDKQNSLYIATLNGVYTADLAWTPDKNYISKPNLFNRLGYCYAKNENYNDSENILKQIVDAVDQQNETAFIQLSNLYLKQEEIKNYIQTQADFYDLVIYDDIKRLKVEEQLIENSGLQWVTRFQRENEFSANMPESNLIVTGQCENNLGCTFSAYRKQSGVMIQEKTLDIQGCTNLTAIDDQLMFIGKRVEADDKVIYSLYNLNPETGTINGKLDLWDQGGNFFPRKIYNFDPFIIIDFDVDDIRYLTAANGATSGFMWEKEFKANLALRTRKINLIMSDSLIIVTLDGQIQAMNLFTGEVDWTYEFEDDFDGIEYISQHSLHNHTMSFLSEDDEYIVLNLENREILFQEELSFEKKWMISFLNHQHIFGYLPTGELVFYEKEGNRIIESWSKNLNQNIELLAVTSNTIYIRDTDNSLIMVINLLDSQIKNTSHLIWYPEDIFIDRGIYSIFNSRKLYLISI